MLYRLVYHVLRFVKRFPYVVPLLLLAILVSAFGGIVYAKIYQNWDRDPDRGAIAIDGGAFGESYSTPRYLAQGWRPQDSLWFYNTTQGSALMPYDFFLALEEAAEESKEPFRSDKNIDRFRYLPQKKTFFNPDALPVGFVKETYQGKDYVGYTCAACHTAQVNYKGEAVRIDGGPAMADMVGFLTELEKAMKTAQEGPKRERFVRAVLALKNDYKTEKAVIDDLRHWTHTVELYNAVNDSTVKYSASERKFLDESTAPKRTNDKNTTEQQRPASGAVTHRDVAYGYARLDAFGRIYNRVLQHSITKDQVAKEMGLVVTKDKKPLLSKEQIDKVLDGLGTRIVLDDHDFSLIVRRLQSDSPGYPGLKERDKLLLIRDQIFNSPNAPVSYPFLWDVAHSDYVQWNGVASNAEVGPLGRNAGEVIGVFGILDWRKDESWFGWYAWLRKFSLAARLSGQTDTKDLIRFDSSINLFNLQRLESNLRSLTSPEWPFCRNSNGEYYLPNVGSEAVSPSEVEEAAKNKGGKPYCSGTDKRFNDEWLWLGRLIYIDQCQSCHTVVDRAAWDRIVVGNMLSIGKAGTDKAMAENSVKYRGMSGNFKDTYQKVDVGSLVVEEDAPVLEILSAATRGVVATPDQGKPWLRRTVEWLYVLVASLGDNTIKASIKRGNYKPDTTENPYDSLLAYRARSLNGIWATAPYLHNGSVPTLEHLLLPPEARPPSFEVGAREFDPHKVGFNSEGYGGFVFDTTVPGNRNAGHNYGTKLDDKERKYLIEYLRSL